jgi:ABC-type uncharacterized transport system ATPase subunit
VIGCADVSRSFGATRALDRVGFSARPGSVHGILGENGAGKSTLMRILFGLDQPDTGTVLIDDRVVRLDSPRSAVALGIGMVHQHFTLVPTLSVLDSCILAAGRGLGVVDRRQWRKRLVATAENLQWQLDPQALIRDLSVGERQRVEIVKALLTGGRCLILDEPTAVLTPQEVDELLPALRSLADGGTTVLFISHKLHEVQRLCDKLTILRRGRVVHDGPAGGVSREQLAELLLGAMPPPAVRSAAQAPGAPRLQVQNLHRGSLREVSFAVAGGEIVGIAGVDGNGQAPLVQAILSDETAVETPGLPAAERLGGAHRLGLIPDDRQHEALVLPLSITANLALKDHRRPPLSWRGWLRPAAWRSRAARLIAAFDIRGAPASASAASLSGGNQQKVVVARELQHEPGLIIAVNPTRGLDLGASAEVMRRLVDARVRGAGVLLLHHDLDELLAVSDRVLVLCGGRLFDSGWPQCTRERIGQLMLGAVDA